MGVATFRGYALGPRAEIIPVGVFLVLPSGYVPLPQLACTRIDDYEGAKPSTAAFRWIGSDRPGWPYPSRFENLIPIDAAGRGILRQDDRVAVASIAPSGALRWLFAGFLEAPELGLSGRTEPLGFQARSDVVRAWDDVLDGSIWRPANAPHDPARELRTDLPLRFNPGGLPNVTATGYDRLFRDTSNPPEVSGARCALLDSRAKVGGPAPPPDPPVPARVHATLEAAVRYLACARTPLPPGPLEPARPPRTEWVRDPTPGEIQDALSVLVPKGPAWDVADPSTYDIVSPRVNDDVLSERPVFEAIEDVLGRHGYGFAFRLDGEPLSPPCYTWDVYPLQRPSPARLKVVSLQPSGILDRGLTNLKSARVARASDRIVNTFRVRASPSEVEASLVLAPLFPIEEADATEANRIRFRSTNPSAPNKGEAPGEIETVPPASYRHWGLDSCGEGHWDVATRTWKVGLPPDLLSLFTTYTARRRPGKGPLVSLAADGRPREIELCILFGYTGKSPGVWDGTGKAWPIKAARRLDEHDAGIWFTGPDPNAISAGQFDAQDKLNRGMVSQIDWLAKPPASGGKPFHLLLTCVIPADRHPEVVAKRLGASPRQFDVSRTVRAEDRAVERVVHASSRFYDIAANPPVGTPPARPPIIVRKLADEVMPDLQSRRAAHQTAQFSGSPEIPRLVNVVGPGDFLRRIDGRDCTLRGNLGATAGVPPVYPRVVGRTWILDGRQATVFSLSDAIPDGTG